LARCSFFAESCTWCALLFGGDRSERAGHSPHSDRCNSVVVGDRLLALPDFDLWWEWADKPVDNKPTIDAAIYDAVMALPPDERRDRAMVSAAF
jgi:hypothetical protein